MLTKKQIDAAKPKDDSWQILPDHGGVPGFGVRVQGHRKVFILRYRTIRGRQRYLTIGQYGVYTLDQARDKARKYLVQISEGGDPAGDLQAQRSAGSVADLCDKWLQLYSKPHRKSWSEDQRRLKSRVKPRLGRLAAADVKVADVAALHVDIGNKEGKSVEANRVLELIRTIWNWGIQQGLLPRDTENPAKGIKRFKERSRERFVTREELPALATSIGKYPNIYVQGAIWMLLLTGLRKNELLSARWDQVDINRRTLRIPDSKGGEPIEAPLSEPALVVLRLLPPIEGNPYIFPGGKRGSHLKGLRQFKEIADKAGLGDIRPHDLRRTLGSWMAEDGASLALIAKALHHRDLSSTQVYARLQEDAATNAIEKHGAEVKRIAGKLLSGSA